MVREDDMARTRKPRPMGAVPEAPAITVKSEPSGISDDTAAHPNDHAEPPAMVVESIVNGEAQAHESPVKRPAPSRLPVIAAALSGGVGGAVAVWAAMAFHLLPALPDASVNNRLEALQREIVTVTNRVVKAEAEVSEARAIAASALDAAGKPSPRSDDAGLVTLSERVTRLENQPVLPPSPVDEALSRRVDAGLADMQKQISALQEASGQTGNRAAVYVVALSLLGDAVRAGRPFASELKTAIAIGGNAARFSALSAQADSGLRSVADLAAQFQGLAPRLAVALEPVVAVPADAGVMDRLKSAFSGVVVITHEGQPLPDEAARQIVRINEALQRGDLAGALAVFAALPPHVRQIAGEWFTQASATMDALDLVKVESSSALQTFSQP